MENSSQSQIVNIKTNSYPEQSLASNLHSALAELTFSHPISRFALEAIFLLLLTSLILSLLTILNIVTEANAVAPLISILLLGTVAFIDFKLFFVPHRIYSNCLTEDQKGNYASALTHLQKLGPKSQFFIHFPALEFYLWKAAILSRSGSKRQALDEIEDAAERFSLSEQAKLLARFNCLLTRCDFEDAEKELDKLNSKEDAKDLKQFALEEALLLIYKRKNWFEAKQLLNEVLLQPVRNTLYSVESDIVARCFLEVCNLKTGRAEEGLEVLGVWIEQIKAMASFKKRLNPLLSHLLLERAHYLATHRAPKSSEQDLAQALGLCQYPLQLQVKTLVEEEL